MQGSEIKIISQRADEIKETLKGTETFKRLSDSDSVIAIFNERAMTKQVPEAEFEKYLKYISEKAKSNPGPDVEDIEQNGSEFMKSLRTRRFMECISVKDGNDIHLLCDDKRSLIRFLNKNRLVLAM